MAAVVDDQLELPHLLAPVEADAVAEDRRAPTNRERRRKTGVEPHDEIRWSRGLLNALPALIGAHGRENITA